LQGARCALGSMGVPKDVADVVVFLASDQARYVTGTVISIDGGRATCDYIPTALA
jgi:NAD(P)-dependent dehydrogenase (short-subunit alcohol dehydrogenase family)